MSEWTLSFGPAHPAAHGVLRLVLWMHGEWVFQGLITCGLLHRGTEKIMELRHAQQCIGYLDRLDYVSMVCNEHVFVMALECMLGVTIAVTGSLLRTIMLETTRMLNHSLHVACHAGDLGCLLCLLWLFEDREILYMFSCSCSGARMHAGVIVPGAVRAKVGSTMIAEMCVYSVGMVARFELLHVLTVQHRLWVFRLGNQGVLSVVMASVTGVLLRSAGVAWDARVVSCYEAYSAVTMVVVFGVVGDSYDRLQCRIAELVGSAFLVLQLGSILVVGSGLSSGVRCVQSCMEQVIGSFKQFCSSSVGSFGVGHSECPKGEFYVVLVLAGSMLWRARLRCSDLLHLWALHTLFVGVMLADVVALVGSVDVVFGSVDL
nr:NADH dehydrogenase subunit 7 [Namystynia karyoxenos]